MCVDFPVVVQCAAWLHLSVGAAIQRQHPPVTMQCLYLLGNEAILATLVSLRWAAAK